MTKNVLFIIAVALILAGFVLVVYGLPNRSLLWQIGLIALALAMLASLATRFGESKEKEKNQEKSEESGNQKEAEDQT